MKTTVDVKWYHVSQNNTGGTFRVDDNLAYHVFFQATSAKHAEAIADDILDNSGSCSCCGNRWDTYWDEDDGYDVPSVYGDPYIPERGKYKFCYVESADYARLHYLDGRVVKWNTPGQTFAELEASLNAS